MNKPVVILAVALWLAATTAAQADNVKKIEGQVMGDIVKTSPLEVTVDVRGTSTQIPVNQIESIRYTGEPARMGTARTAIEAGRYEDAVTGMEGVNLDEIGSPLVKQDAQFLTALAKARIALASADQKAVVEAGKLMASFVKNNPQSYRYFQACEVLGDLYVAVGEYAAAGRYYGEVAAAPWPEYQMRAGVALGQALLAEGKTDEALKHFEKVLATEAAGESAARQRLAATLGKARCLAQAASQAEEEQAKKRRLDEAVTLIQDVIAKGNPEQSELFAQAYNALGLAHRTAGRIQDALLAYLHVDVLYFNSPREHIEALENLTELWEQDQQPERADEASEILQERYNRNPRSK
jgi:tetratricopeptide (TPR) repeat protein